MMGGLPQMAGMPMAGAAPSGQPTAPPKPMGLSQAPLDPSQGGPVPADPMIQNMLLQILQARTPGSVPPIRLSREGEGAPKMPQSPLQGMASLLQGMGRNGDTILAHINPEEARLLADRGGAATRNPVTGALEFYDAYGSDSWGEGSWGAGQGDWGGASVETGYDQDSRGQLDNLVGGLAEAPVEKGGFSLTPAEIGQYNFELGLTNPAPQTYDGVTKTVMDAMFTPGFTPEQQRNVATSYLDAINFDPPDGSNKYGARDYIGNTLANNFGVYETIDLSGKSPNASWAGDPAGLIGGVIGGPALGALAQGLSDRYGNPLQIGSGVRPDAESYQKRDGNSKTSASEDQSYRTGVGSQYGDLVNKTKASDVDVTGSGGGGGATDSIVDVAKPTPQTALQWFLNKYGGNQTTYGLQSNPHQHFEQRPVMAASGGYMGDPEVPMGGLEMMASAGPVNGPGSGQEDKIPALLSDGEYVIDATTVADLGDGSSKEGARVLDEFRAQIAKHKGRKHKDVIPPPAKKPTQYLT